MDDSKERREKLSKSLNIVLLKSDLLSINFSICDSNGDMSGLAQYTTSVVQATDGVGKLHGKSPDETDDWKQR